MDYANWFVGGATFFLGLVAILQEWIKVQLFHPNLDCSIKTVPPDCHRTVVQGNNPFYAFYYTFRISNKGNRAAKNIEVLISDVSQRKGDTDCYIEGFLPDNLNWTLLSEPIYVGERIYWRSKVYCDYISPNTSKHCNLGHIHDPAFRDSVGEDNPDLHLPQKETIFCFDVHFRSSRPYYLVAPGTYIFKITVGSSNAKSMSKFYEMTVTGKWFTDEDRMLNEGLIIKEIAKGSNGSPIKQGTSDSSAATE
ncbi:MAG: hypothetical protein M0Z79_07360 [Nitrospiraceae bacterium]|nr:hypothetical protein [Nitrospiraceae bacterium]